jgi:astacin (peptidase family M12A)
MTNQSRFCSLLTTGSLTTADQQILSRTRAALLNGAKWPVASIITVRFLSGDPTLQQRVRKVTEEWTNLAALTLDFRTSAPTDIRIAFIAGNGSWSHLGTMCRDIPEPKPTMNFGWLTPSSSDDELRRVVLHEFGHALGLIHEHQNPDGGITWNRAAVIADLSGPPNNWDAQTIENNIFKKYAPDALTETGLDPLSIMMYPIPAAWTIGGFSSGLNGELSATDKQFIAENYPK